MAKKSFTVRLDERAIAQIKSEAERQGISQGEVIDAAMNLLCKGRPGRTTVSGRVESLEVELAQLMMRVAKLENKGKGFG